MGTCRKVSVFLFFLLVSFPSWAQTNRYMVFFNDKAGTPHAIDQPSTFLSSRALQRRMKMGIVVNQDDLPVVPSYVSQVRATGAKAFFTTRWMNGLVIEATTAQVTAIEALPFVVSTEFVAPNHRLLGGRKAWPSSFGATSSSTDDQLHMLGLDTMHEDGYRGEGVMIAVLDSGFPGVDTQPPFKGLRDDGRIVMTRDFITNSGNVYQFHEHGTQILSIMAAESPSFQGGAPGATYLLFATEDETSEYRIEEYNWLFAAEQADSAGADIIQSSLGYNLFDDPSMNYSTAMLDGATAIVSKAAALSRDRGILVVVSAGNEGGTPWQLIAFPADADGILSVGAVTISGVKASFSSVGPSADGRVKPDVSALGVSVSTVGSDGEISAVSGTSAAAPLVSSLAAGLIQAKPTLKFDDLIDAIRLSATLGDQPNNSLGFGIPSYHAAKNYLAEGGSAKVSIHPNPVQNTLWLYPGTVGDSVELTISDMQGKTILSVPFTVSWTDYPIPIDVSGLGAGVYILRITVPSAVLTIRFVKL